MASKGLHHIAIFFIVTLVYSPSNGTRCEDTSIGVEAKGIIPDTSFSATSEYDYRYRAHFARLLRDSNEYGWGPANPQSSPDHYLQIDLGFEYFVCAIASKAGRTNEYVKTYKVTMSTDNKHWKNYMENSQIKILKGNQDSSSIVKSILKDKPLMRYIRIWPLEYYKYKVIKLAIYGYAKFEACTNNPLGMESGSIKNFTASSFQQTLNARLHSDSSWCPQSSDSSPYFQIDLGSDHVICAVATQGDNAADHWITSYHIWIARDESSLISYKENNVTRTFSANLDRSSTSFQVLFNSPTARHVRIVPKGFHGLPCLRLELYGYQLEPTCSKHSTGVPSPLIVLNHRFKASSIFSSMYASYARLEGDNSWWADNKNSGYLQVDLGQVFRICAVRTQGAPNRDYWVTQYTVKYSSDNELWTTYSGSDGKDVVFTGNSDKSTIVTNSIQKPFKAKFIRVNAISSHTWIALRVDFKGVAEVCVSPLGLENNEIPAAQMTASSYNDINHTPSHGRLYKSASWCSRGWSNTEYIQVDLGKLMSITGIATQGYQAASRWTTTYKVDYAYSSGTWFEYKEGSITKVFNGNKDKNSIRVNWLSQPMTARFVRIFSLTNNAQKNHCLRLGLYGCPFVIPNEVSLPSNNGSLVTLKCTVATSQPTPHFQWYLNYKTKVQGATQSSLQVQFISADDVVSKSKCSRKDPSKRPVICRMNYTCITMKIKDVPKTNIAEAWARVTVNLNVPDKFVFTVIPGKRTLNITWVNQHIDDVGRFTGFNISLDGKVYKVVSGWTWAAFKQLTPYTSYKLQMRAFSAVGGGIWSDVQNVSTLVAEPEGSPSRVSANALSSTSMEVKWESTSIRLNGPMKGFRITYTDENGEKSLKEVGDVRSVLLTGLKKWMTYKITLSIGNTLYYGQESTIISQQTQQDAPECPLKLNSANALTSTSIRVSWDPLATSCRNGILQGFKVFYRKKGLSNNQPITISKSDATSFDVVNLEKYQTYMFSVVAFTIKDGNPSNELQQTTLQDAPSAPSVTDIKLIPPKGKIRSPQVQIVWEKPANENGIITLYTIAYHYGNDLSNQTKVNISKISHLNYTLDVLGEATFTCKVSATTIKEGPYSSTNSKIIPAYAPAVGPKDINMNKVNESTFGIAWQPLPREQANGIVKFYKVTWTVSHIIRAKRMAVGDVQSWMTKETQFVLSGLRLCAQYRVDISAATAGGLGPNGTLTIQTSYSPLITASPINVTKNKAQSVTFQCTVEGKPLPTVTWWLNNVQINTNDSVKYNVVGLSSVNSGVTSLTLNNLVRGDEGFYRCKAENSCGSAQSDPAYLTVNYARNIAFVGTFKCTSCTYNEALADNKSEEFKDLKEKIESFLKSIYALYKYVTSIRVLKFWPGSVYVEFELMLKGPAPDPLSPLKAVASNKKENLDGISVELSSIKMGAFFQPTGSTTPEKSSTSTVKRENISSIVILALGVLLGLSLIGNFLFIGMWIWKYRKGKKENKSRRTSENKQDVVYMNSMPHAKPISDGHENMAHEPIENELKQEPSISSHYQSITNQDMQTYSSLSPRTKLPPKPEVMMANDLYQEIQGASHEYQSLNSSNRV